MRSIINGRGITTADVIEFDGMRQPAIAPVGKARVYFSESEGNLKQSTDMSPYRLLGGSVTIGLTFPENPAFGAWFINSTTGVLYVYYFGVWQELHVLWTGVNYFMTESGFYLLKEDGDILMVEGGGNIVVPGDLLLKEDNDILLKEDTETLLLEY